MANFNYNKITLGGRLTNDPQMRQTQAGHQVVSFGMAVNRRSGDNQVTDFFNVTAWRTTAEFVAKYFKKGMSICVNGTCQNSKWKDSNGVEHYSVEIVADEVFFVDSKGDGNIPPSNVDNTDDELPLQRS